MPQDRAPIHTKESVRRTSLNLDTALVQQARAVLGTAGTTDTVHRALEQVVLRERRRRAAALRFDDLTAGELEQLRRWQDED
jgi:Arc/MetJ family transcription regulator